MESDEGVLRSESDHFFIAQNGIPSFAVSVVLRSIVNSADGDGRKVTTQERFYSWAFGNLRMLSGWSRPGKVDK